MGANVTFQNVNQVLLEVLDQMYLVCAGIAMLILFLSVYRNYKEFGEYLGIRYLIGLLLTIVFLFLYPEMSDYLFKGMLSWGRDTGKRVEEIVSVLLKVEVEGGWLDTLIVALANLFYQGAIWVGSFFRDIMILVCCGLFIILKTLSPLFIAMLAVPETKSVAVNFLTLAFGFIMFPLVMVFGDLTMVWVVCQLWEHTGMAVAAGLATGVGGAVGGSLAALAANPPAAVVVAAGAAGVLFAFACVFLLLCIVIYVGIPWACLSLFRGAGIGNALAMSLNTAANVMALSRAVQSSKGFSKGLSDLATRKAPSGGDNQKNGMGETNGSTKNKK